MKNSFLKMSVIALTFWLGLVAGSANAVTEITLSGSATTGYAGVFGQVVSGVFNNTYSFMMPSDASGNGASNTISLANDGSFSYSAFNLYSDITLLAKVATGVISSIGTWDFATLSFANLSAPATYYLNVMGSTSARPAAYAGNINISPVPEPEVYTMMLVGLGLIGYSVRRRNQNI